MRMVQRILLLAALAVMIASGAGAQTPPQGDDLTTGLPYACENTLGFQGCEEMLRGLRKPPPAPLPDVWAAVAVSPSNLAWGVKWSANSERQAKAEAMATCARRAKDCAIVKTTADICLALVQSFADKVSIVMESPASNFASDKAMAKCRNAGGHSCKLLTAFCADGEKHEVHGTIKWSNGNPIFVPEGSSGAAFGRR
jgi:hypothetical protein